MFDECLHHALRFIGVQHESDGCTAAELGEHLCCDVFASCGWAANATLRNTVVRLLVSEHADSITCYAMHSNNNNSSSNKKKVMTNSSSSSSASSNRSHGDVLLSRDEVLHRLDTDAVLWSVADNNDNNNDDGNSTAAQTPLRICPTRALRAAVLHLPLHAEMAVEVTNYLAEYAVSGVDRLGGHSTHTAATTRAKTTTTSSSSKDGVVSAAASSSSSQQQAAAAAAPSRHTYRTHLLTNGMSWLRRLHAVSLVYLYDTHTRRLVYRYFPAYATPLSEVEKLQLQHAQHARAQRSGGEGEEEEAARDGVVRGELPLDRYFARKRARNNNNNNNSNSNDSSSPTFPDVVFDTHLIRYMVTSSPQRRLLLHDAVHAIFVAHRVRQLRWRTLSRHTRMLVRRMLGDAHLRILAAAVQVRGATTTSSPPSRRRVHLVVPAEDVVVVARGVHHGVDVGAAMATAAQDARGRTRDAETAQNASDDDNDDEKSSSGDDDDDDSTHHRHHGSAGSDGSDEEGSGGGSDHSGDEDDEEVIDDEEDDEQQQAHRGAARSTAAHGVADDDGGNTMLRHSAAATTPLLLRTDVPVELQAVDAAQRRPVALSAVYPRLRLGGNARVRQRGLGHYVAAYAKLHGTLHAHYVLSRHTKSFTVVYAPAHDSSGSSSSSGNTNNTNNNNNNNTKAEESSDNNNNATAATSDDVKHDVHDDTGTRATTSTRASRFRHGSDAQLPKGLSAYALQAVLDALQRAPDHALTMPQLSTLMDVTVLVRRVLPYLRSTGRVQTSGVTLSRGLRRIGIVALADAPLDEATRRRVAERAAAAASSSSSSPSSSTRTAARHGERQMHRGGRRRDTAGNASRHDESAQTARGDGLVHDDDSDNDNNNDDNKSSMADMTTPRTTLILERPARTMATPSHRAVQTTLVLRTLPPPPAVMHGAICGGGGGGSHTRPGVTSDVADSNNNDDEDEEEHTHAALRRRLLEARPQASRLVDRVMAIRNGHARQPLYRAARLHLELWWQWWHLHNAQTRRTSHRDEDNNNGGSSNTTQQQQEQQQLTTATTSSASVALPRMCVRDVYECMTLSTFCVVIGLAAADVSAVLRFDEDEDSDGGGDDVHTATSSNNSNSSSSKDVVSAAVVAAAQAAARPRVSWSTPLYALPQPVQSWCRQRGVHLLLHSLAVLQERHLVECNVPLHALTLHTTTAATLSTMYVTLQRYGSHGPRTFVFDNTYTSPCTHASNNNNKTTTTSNADDNEDGDGDDDDEVAVTRACRSNASAYMVMSYWLPVWSRLTSNTATVRYAHDIAAVDDNVTLPRLVVLSRVLRTDVALLAEALYQHGGVPLRRRRRHGLRSALHLSQHEQQQAAQQHALSSSSSSAMHGAQTPTAAAATRRVHANALVSRKLSKTSARAVVVRSHHHHQHSGGGSGDGAEGGGGRYVSSASAPSRHRRARATTARVEVTNSTVAEAIVSLFALRVATARRLHELFAFLARARRVQAAPHAAVCPRHTSPLALAAHLCLAVASRSGGSSRAGDDDDNNSYDTAAVAAAAAAAALAQEAAVPAAQRSWSQYSSPYVKHTLAHLALLSDVAQLTLLSRLQRDGGLLLCSSSSSSSSSGSGSDSGGGVNSAVSSLPPPMAAVTRTAARALRALAQCDAAAATATASSAPLPLRLRDAVESVFAVDAAYPRNNASVTAMAAEASAPHVGEDNEDNDNSSSSSAAEARVRRLSAAMMATTDGDDENAQQRGQQGANTTTSDAAAARRQLTYAMDVLRMILLSDKAHYDVTVARALLLAFAPGIVARARACLQSMPAFRRAHMLQQQQQEMQRDAAAAAAAAGNAAHGRGRGRRPQQQQEQQQSSSSALRRSRIPMLALVRRPRFFAVRPLRSAARQCSNAVYLHTSVTAAQQMLLTRSLSGYTHPALSAAQRVSRALVTCSSSNNGDGDGSGGGEEEGDVDNVDSVAMLLHQPTMHISGSNNVSAAHMSSTTAMSHASMLHREQDAALAALRVPSFAWSPRAHAAEVAVRRATTTASVLPAYDNNNSAQAPSPQQHGGSGAAAHTAAAVIGDGGVVRVGSAAVAAAARRDDAASSSSSSDDDDDDDSNEASDADELLFGSKSRRSDAYTAATRAAYSARARDAQMSDTARLLYPARTLVGVDGVVALDAVPADPPPTAAQRAAVQRALRQLSAHHQNDNNNSSNDSKDVTTTRASWCCAYPSIFHHVDGAFHAYVWRSFVTACYHYVLCVPGITHATLVSAAMQSGLVSRRAVEAALRVLVHSRVLLRTTTAPMVDNSSSSSGAMRAAVASPFAPRKRPRHARDGHTAHITTTTTTTTTSNNNNNDDDDDSEYDSVCVAYHATVPLEGLWDLVQHGDDTGAVQSGD